ncbi:ATP-binding protein [Streptomyces sp. A1547]|uniref:sensor histidine kinase n=1 Tax=Streptomyces sp. A1547 TaxID=2563105 RepID=UPI00109EDCF1|nr:ATP-binding protein [Streptomyces sp. A1547]THA37296.1 histidine kinase [Streptomyces sp. A1547]
MAVLHIPLAGSAARSRAKRTDRPSFTLQANALQALCRRVFAFRMVVIGLGAPLALGRTVRGGPTYLVGGAVLLTFMLSYVLFRDWERFGPLLLRHRWLLAPDMAFCGLLLVTATPASPLGLAVLCTPLLAGLVHGWRGSAVYAALAAALVVAVGGGGLTLPVLCLLAGAAGASVRDLLFRFGSASQALTETRARLAAAEAVRAERDHLAREMHDSVSKTLHGLALAADALARTTDPAALRRQACFLSGAARAAAAESRALLTDLRGDAEAPGVSLQGELRRLVGADAELRTKGTLPVVAPGVAHHLLSITSEALENARRHAGASRVLVSAAVDGRDLTLTVEDDGCGLPPDALRTAVRGGRFGLLGMTERAASIGARLRIGVRPSGPGTLVRLDLPLAALNPEGSP